MLNRIICFFVALSVVTCSSVLNVSGVDLAVSAESAILMNADNGEIIYEKNAYEERGIASTTKIMTTLIALERGHLEDVVTVNDSDFKVEGTSIGLKEGDTISLETLVYGMLLESGNDAANVTATAIGGSLSGFTELMNKKAESLGMKNSAFKNPSGLSEEGHYSTAYDMAVLTSHAIKNEKFCEICSKRSLRVSYGKPQYERTFYNHNKLLERVEGVFGVKTGFTKASGRCLVSAAERNGVTLVAVTLCAPDDWNDHEKLLEYGFNVTQVYDIYFDADKLKVAVVGSDVKSISVKLSESPEYMSADEKKRIETVVYCAPFLYAPIKKGEKVGKVFFYDIDGKILCERALISQSDVPINFTEVVPLSLLEKLKRIITYKR